MNRASLRRIAQAGFLSLGLAALGACSAESPAAPTGEVPLFGSIPGGVGLATDNSLDGETFKVCKIYRGAVGPDVSVRVQVDEGNDGPGAGDEDFTVLVGDGECVAVWSTGGNVGTTDLVTVTETEPAGFVSATAKATVEDGVETAAGPATPGATASNTITNPGGTGVDGVVVTFINELIPSDGCTVTLGFWKSHTEVGDWPALPGGTLLLGTVAYSEAQLITILNTENNGNGLLQLARQLIAAKLNILNGASATDISATITAADALIGGLVVPPVGGGFLSPGSTSSLIDALSQYNQGNTGPGRCPN